MPPLALSLPALGALHLLLTATDGANKYVIDDDGCERKMSSIKGASHSIHWRDWYSGHVHHYPALFACSGDAGSGWHQQPLVMAARDAALPAGYRSGSFGAFDFTQQYLLKCSDKTCTRADLVTSHGFPVGVFPSNKMWDEETQEYFIPSRRKPKCGMHTASGKRSSRSAVPWTPPQPSTAKH